LRREDAYWFPIIGSGVLFGLYLVFHYFGKEYINLLLTFYFVALGAAAVENLFSNVARKVGGNALKFDPDTCWNLFLTSKSKGSCQPFLHPRSRVSSHYPRSHA
jgi:hypothetical protein